MQYIIQVLSKHTKNTVNEDAHQTGKNAKPEEVGWKKALDQASRAYQALTQFIQLQPESLLVLHGTLCFKSFGDLKKKRKKKEKKERKNREGKV